MIDRLTRNKKEVEAQYAAQEPIGRLGNPNEVANAVIWLCSIAASFAIVHAMPVDVDWTAQ